MMLKLFVVVLLSIVSLAISGEMDAAQKEKFMKIAAAICAPNAAADKLKNAKDCEKMIPKTVIDVYASCAKSSLGVPELTLPILCYKARPDANKFIQCLHEREEEAKSHGIVMDPQKKEDFKIKILDCMVKVV